MTRVSFDFKGLLNFKDVEVYINTIERETFTFRRIRRLQGFEDLIGEVFFCMYIDVTALCS